MTFLAYPEAGHAALGPPTEPGMHPPPAEAMMGGTVEATDAARVNAWPRILDELDAALKPA